VLRIFDWKTQRWAHLADIPLTVEPTWSRDSRFVYFNTDDTATAGAALYRVRIADHYLETIASLREVARTHGDDWAGVAPDGTPLISRSFTISEIYALEMEWP
jgi:hypothetical protein